MTSALSLLKASIVNSTNVFKEDVKFEKDLVVKGKIVEGTKDSIEFMLNGRKVTIKNPEPSLSVLDFLRYNTKYTGTKKNCNQGGCGVCTVMLSFKDQQDGLLRNVSVNSCIKLLVQCDGMAITTSEGIGSSMTGFHPVQERIHMNQGLQCGACTTGQVMSMYSALQPNTYTQSLNNVQNAEKMLDGNLCRCSCYLGIIKTAKSFAAGSDVSGYPTTYNASSDVNANTYSQFLNGFEDKLSHYSSKYFDQEYYVPSTMDELKDIMKSLDSFEYVCGNTQIGPYGKSLVGNRIDVSRINELHQYSDSESSVTLGGSVPTNKVVSKLQVSGNQKLTKVAEHLYYISGQGVRNVATLGGSLSLTKYRGFSGDVAPVLMAAGATVTIFNGMSTMTMPVLEYLNMQDNGKQALIVSITIPKGSSHEFFFSFRLSKRRMNAVAWMLGAFNYVLDSENKIVKATVVYGSVENGTSARPVFANNTMAYLVGKQMDNSTLSGAINLLKSEINLQVLDKFRSQDKPAGIVESRSQYVPALLYKSFLNVLAAKGLIGSEFESGVEDWITKTRTPASYERFYQNDPNTHAFNQDILKPDGQIIASGEAKYSDELPFGPDDLFGTPVLPAVAIGTVDWESTKSKAALAAARAHSGVHMVLTAADTQVFTPFIAGPPNPYLLTSFTHCGAVIALVLAENKDVANKVAYNLTHELSYINVPPDGVFPANVEDAINKQSWSPAQDAFALAFKSQLYRPVKVKGFELGDGSAELPAFTQVSYPDTKEQGAQTSENIGSYRFRIPEIHHGYLEPQVCYVTTDPITGDYKVYSACQALQEIQNAAIANGFDPSRVSGLSMRVGGGYGGKLGQTAVKFIALALVAARASGRPVRVQPTIEGDYKINAGRADITYKSKVGFNNDGKINSLRSHAYVNGHGYVDFWVGLFISDSLCAPTTGYDIANMYYDFDILNLPRGDRTTLRGAGNPQHNFYINSVIDYVAGKTGKTFNEIVSKNLLRDISKVSIPANIFLPDVGAIVDLPPLGYQDFGVESANMYELLYNKLTTEPYYDFANRQAAVSSFNTQNKWKKRSIQVSAYTYASDLTYGVFFGTRYADVKVLENGKVTVMAQVNEIGQAANAKVRQACAHFLECPIENVEWLPVEMKNFPTGGTGGGGSVGTIAAIRAVRQACLKIKSNWDEPEDVPFGNVDTSGIEGFESMTTPEKVAATWPLRFKADSARATHAQDRLGPWTVMYMALTEVELDILTGKSQILRTDVAYDIGKSINPPIDMGQLEGGYIMSLGYALTEERYYDSKHMLMTKDMWDYKLPCVVDIPEKMSVAFLSNVALPQDRLETFGSKPVSEMGASLGASAFFAVKECIRFSRLERGLSGDFELDPPATIDRVLQALELDTAAFALPQLLPPGISFVNNKFSKTWYAVPFPNATEPEESPLYVTNQVQLLSNNTTTVRNIIRAKDRVTVLKDATETGTYSINGDIISITIVKEGGAYILPETLSGYYTKRVLSINSQTSMMSAVYYGTVGELTVLKDALEATGWIVDLAAATMTTAFPVSTSVSIWN